MRRAIILATAGLGLAGCGSMSIPGLDALRPTPPSMTLQLESLPPGAEARTSLGPSCRTPCAVSIPRTDNFTVTYTLDRYLPQTVPVRLVEPQFVADTGGDDGVSTVQEATFDPSPVYVELQAAPPPRRPKAAPKAQPKAPPRTVTAPPPAPAAAPAPMRPASSSPFPSPAASSPFPSPR
jgi:hypothetical protein